MAKNYNNGLQKNSMEPYISLMRGNMQGIIAKIRFIQGIFDFVADGNDTITFAIDGVGHWEGIEVWVNNKNVYGKDCYPITGWYTTIEDKTGSELNWVGTNNYYPRIYKKRNFAIKWKQNIPLTGTAIKVKLATRQWSADYAHPRNGDYIDNSLGRALVYAISKI